MSEPLLFPDANLQSPRTRRHKFPSTDAELKAAGYVFTGSAKCQGTFCQTWIYWYLTPNGKRLPMSKVVNCPGDILEPHFLVCICAKEFRRGAKGA